MSGGGPSLYVYGVVSASEAPDIDVSGVGDEGAALRAVVHDEVAAVVSEVGDEPLAAARDLRAHWRVLEELGSRTTVVPVRFATVMAGEEALVDEFLAPQAERLRTRLEELRGKVQLSLKAFYDEERLLGEVVSQSPSVARLRERIKGLPAAAAYYERIQLGELVSAEVEQRREEDAALVLDRLEPLAVAAKSEPVGAPDMAVNVALLVEASRVEELNQAVGRLTTEVGDRMRVRYVGPMPPYSFADTDADQPTETGAWA